MGVFTHLPRAAADSIPKGYKIRGDIAHLTVTNKTRTDIVRLSTPIANNCAFDIDIVPVRGKLDPWMIVFFTPADDHLIRSPRGFTTDENKRLVVLRHKAFHEMRKLGVIHIRPTAGDDHPDRVVLQLAVRGRLFFRMHGRTPCLKIRNQSLGAMCSSSTKQ